jgi:hypothetical protein
MMPQLQPFRRPRVRLIIVHMQARHFQVNRLAFYCFPPQPLFLEAGNLHAQSYNINTDMHASDSHIIQKSALLLRCLPNDPLGNGGVLLTQLIYHTFDVRVTENPKIVSNDLRFVLKYRVLSLLPSPW